MLLKQYRSESNKRSSNREFSYDPTPKESEKRTSSLDPYFWNSTNAYSKLEKDEINRSRWLSLEGIKRSSYAKRKIDEVEKPSTQLQINAKQAQFTSYELPKSYTEIHSWSNKIDKINDNCQKINFYHTSNDVQVKSNYKSNDKKI